MYFFLTADSSQENGHTLGRWCRVMSGQILLIVTDCSMVRVYVKNVYFTIHNTIAQLCNTNKADLFVFTVYSIFRKYNDLKINSNDSLKTCVITLYMHCNTSNSCCLSQFSFPKLSKIPVSFHSLIGKICRVQQTFIVESLTTILSRSGQSSLPQN